ncbi:MAG TPA: dCTP deaminase [Candidatus Limnocylindrales bacterium]|nr:dCTP deaminase [Candidatus Limnocylindrales bacterium]
MVLSRDSLLAEIKAGTVTIDPFDEQYLGPASYDLHLGSEIRVLNRFIKSVDVTEDSDYVRFSKVEALVAPYELAPGQTILGITRERISLSPQLCGWLEGRSRFARLGLMIHITAGFVAPGVSNRQVLEISNVAPYALRIHAGVRIAQLIVQRVEGAAVYKGRFAQQMDI